MGGDPEVAAFTARGLKFCCLEAVRRGLPPLFPAASFCRGAGFLVTPPPHSSLGVFPPLWPLVSPAAALCPHSCVGVGRQKGKAASDVGGEGRDAV